MNTFKRVGLTCKNVVAADDQPLKTCEPYVSGTNTLINGVSYPGSVMVDSGANANVKSNAGIEFFMDHTILINFDRGEEGWK